VKDRSVMRDIQMHETTIYHRCLVPVERYDKSDELGVETKMKDSTAQCFHVLIQFNLILTKTIFPEDSDRLT